MSVHFLRRPEMPKILFVTAFLLLLTSVSSAQSVSQYNPRTVLRKPVRAIVDPPVIAADQAKLSDNELVIGVEVDGQARAYPINQLTGPSREIINDTLGGTAIAATW
jgi:hypothetical protein